MFRYKFAAYVDQAGAAGYLPCIMDINGGVASTLPCITAAQPKALAQWDLPAIDAHMEEAIFAAVTWRNMGDEALACVADFANSIASTDPAVLAALEVLNEMAPAAGKITEMIEAAKDEINARHLEATYDERSAAYAEAREDGYRGRRG